jgi:hypothetical protein
MVMGLFRKTPLKEAGSSIACYCIGHKPMAFVCGAPHLMISPDPSCADIHVPDDALGDAFHGGVLSEYTQLFALADQLRKQTDRPHAVYLFQYRKFLTPVAQLPTCSNMSYASCIKPDAAATVFPSMDMLLNSGFDMIHGPQIQFQGSVGWAYGMSHHAEDFMGLLLSVKEQADFSHLRCANFIHLNAMLPAPALGLYPTEFFLDSMQILKEVWSVFRANYYQERQGYQRRVGGFLMERLHSFLVLEHKHFHGQGQKIGAWNMAVVTEDGQAKPTH